MICPRCKSDEIYVSLIDDDFIVSCKTCGFSAERSETEEGAIEKWMKKWKKACKNPEGSKSNG